MTTAVTQMTLGRERIQGILDIDMTIRDLLADGRIHSDLYSATRTTSEAEAIA